MRWWLLKCRLRFRFSRKQKAALAGKIPMTKDLFWECLNIAYCRHDMKTYWEIWNSYPEYVDKFNEEFDREMANPNSDLRKEHDAWWANLRSKLVEEFGEEWVAKNCKD